MSRESISSVLSKYIPSAAIEICTTWIIQKNIHLKITRGRASKFGDYRPLEPGKGHRISVNHDLNQYSFLITFIHEVAHLQTFVKFKDRFEPHGKEWKMEFSALLSDFMLRNIFPDDIRTALMTYVKNPAASSCSDHHLLRTLRKYDKPEEGILHVEDLSIDTLFRVHQSRSGYVFKKGRRIRRRFECLEVNTNRIYLFSPLAEVSVIEAENGESRIAV